MLFDILGWVTQNSCRELKTRVNATKNTFEFISRMFENATLYEQFRLWHKCMMSFISKFSKPVDQEIADLFFFIQEIFVIKLIPNYSVEDAVTEKVWDIHPQYSDKNQQEWLIEMRRLVFSVYTNSLRRIDNLNITDLFKISLPVIISGLHENGDVFTGEAPNTEYLTKCIQILDTSLMSYNPVLLELQKHVVYKLLTILGPLHEGFNHQQHEFSYAFSENSSLSCSFLDYISKIVFFDIGILNLKKSNGNSDFLNDLIEYIGRVILNPTTVQCTEKAIRLVIAIVKELTPYEDDIEISKKQELIGNYTKVDRTGKRDDLSIVFIVYRWVPVRSGQFAWPQHKPHPRLHLHCER